MKVAFVCAEDEYPGVSSLSSYLKERGCQVELVFEPKQFNRAYVRNGFLARVFSREKENLEELKVIKPDLVGFSCVTAHYRWAIDFAQAVKRELPRVPIIFGGAHPTLVPEVVIEEDCVDFVCIGEGERPLLELLQSMERGDFEYPIPNIWYKKDGQVKVNPLHSLNQDLDGLPYMDKGLFTRHMPKQYRENCYFFTSRGCPFTCSFCGNEQMKKTFRGRGRYTRQMSVPRVIRELTFLKEKFGARRILFEDDVLTANRRWLKEFIPAYREKIDLPFTCFGHPKFLSAEIISLLKDGGCELVWFGIQSANEKIRQEILDRTETNVEIIKTAELCRKAGLKFMVDHVLNIPHDNEAAIKEAIGLYNRIRPGMINCYRLLYFPKAKIIDTALEVGLLKPEDIDLINRGESVVYQTGQLSREADFYSRYALLLTVIPLMPRQWVTRIQKSDRLIELFGHLPLFLIPLVKIILNFRIDHGFLPLSIIRMEAFYTRRIMWLKLKRLFRLRKGIDQ